MVKLSRRGLEKVTEFALRAGFPFLMVTLARRPTALAFRSSVRDALEGLGLHEPGDWAVVRHDSAVDEFVHDLAANLFVLPLRDVDVPTTTSGDLVLLSSTDVSFEDVKFTLADWHGHPRTALPMIVQLKDVTPTPQQLEELATRTAAALKAGTARIDEELAETRAALAQRLARTASGRPGGGIE